MLRRAIGFLSLVVLNPRTESSSGEYVDEEILHKKLLEKQEFVSSCTKIVKQCFKNNPKQKEKCMSLFEEYKRQIEQPPCPIDSKKEFHVQDKDHPEEKVGTANTMEEAIGIAAVDSMGYISRDYTICKGPCETNRAEWFGNSWDLQQWYSERGKLKISTLFEKHNLRTMFAMSGMTADVVPTSEPHVYSVKPQR